AEAPRELEARTVAAAFRQRLTTGREYDVFSLDCSAGDSDPEATITSRDVEHTPPGNQLHARRIGSSQERVQHITCASTDRKQFPVGFLLQRHIKLPEELDRVV